MMIFGHEIKELGTKKILITKNRPNFKISDPTERRMEKSAIGNYKYATQISLDTEFNASAFL